MTTLILLAIAPFFAAAVDPHSFANPKDVEVRHVHLDLRVDFVRRVLSGSARLDLARKGGADAVSLDTRDLAVSSVVDATTGQGLAHHYGRRDPNFGQELVVSLAHETQAILIRYETSPSAHAVQWLEPAQTLGKKHPFLFTQSQSIHARSWIPLQDTPEVRVTYSAEIQVPPELMALMSASNPQVKSSDGRYHFDMPQPVPPYLIALAVGDVEFRALSARTGVYAEPAGLEAAWWELGNMERMLQIGEQIAGMPYAWDRYDTLILPPSFPFGGMENPRLTFATPTVITGDRSLESLHAHEASHSWTGNLVTNKNADHFWLNEGFTVYLERRILEAMYGKDAADTQALVEYEELVQIIRETEPQFTKLRTDLTGVDPDEVYSSIPYEKGYLFLRHIEDVIGRRAFDQFLHDYIAHFKFRSIDTDDFLTFLEEKIIRGNEGLRLAINAHEWIDGTGLPEQLPELRSHALERVDQVLANWAQTGDLASEAVSGFSTFEWVRFLSRLPSDLSDAKVRDLDATYGLTASSNAEVLTEWLKFAIGKHYEPAVVRAADFLKSVGRGKFVRPLYKALDLNGYQDVAKTVFSEAAPGYHNITRLAVSRAHPYLSCEGDLN